MFKEIIERITKSLKEKVEIPVAIVVVPAFLLLVAVSLMFMFGGGIDPKVGDICIIDKDYTLDSTTSWKVKAVSKGYIYGKRMKYRTLDPEWVSINKLDACFKDPIKYEEKEN